MYYIEDEKGNFWCENNFGYWSSFKKSLKHRFEGIWLWVFPVYIIMRLCNVKCKMVKFSERK